jgi:hypothetical protein
MFIYSSAGTTMFFFVMIDAVYSYNNERLKGHPYNIWHA